MGYSLIMSRDGKFVDIQQIGPQYKTTVMSSAFQ